MTDADDIAARAREISTRAEQIAGDATDSQALRDELERLDAELAQLDQERRRLDEELGGSDEAQASFDDERDRGSGRPSWADTVADVLADVGERITALGTGAWPWRSSQTVDRTVAVDGAVPVVIDNRAGSIKVRAGDGDAVTVSAELFAPNDELLNEMTVIAERDGDDVVIKTDWPEQRRGRRARLTVTVPVGSGVKAKTIGGSVDLKQTRGTVDASTTGGSIAIEAANGETKARTMGGSIRVSEHTGPVHASTKGGSVHLSGRLTDDVDATTMGGSIHIDGSDSATVNASTSGGSIRVKGRLRGFSRMRTAGGSVMVSIPPDNQLTVDAKGTSVTSDFTDLDVSRGRIEGTLGDGNDGCIELRTAGGSISLLKA
ncbi:MAG TPA: DUF4097 family beta strand repeat-containing protein [Acidimicrobiales bacterium]|nr:DUF4097 family beta strand repeat-containing protein [Acidimicrobiales bacterium]